MPAGVVKVSRPSTWGNPWPVGRPGPDGFVANTAAEAVERFEKVSVDGPYGPSRDRIRRELGDRDVACWCALDAPCHGDVYLKIANDPGDE